ncbi:hypothetical protein RFF05_08270 [Bengtsoniella intestinalis]|uniref:hypothetical protein n=1 Tax=Bengtsoniella intestinalis TaxID=3073143 RepID=UPI00391F95FA
MEVFARNFLQDFESEQASLSKGADNADMDFSDLQPPSVEALSNYVAVDIAQYKHSINAEKVAMFHELYKPLERFADETIADLRIEYDESVGKGSIQLKYHSLDSAVCPQNQWHTFLALLFQMYADFSITVVDGCYVVLKFYVDLTDKVQVNDYSKQLELLRACIGLSE